MEASALTWSSAQVKAEEHKEKTELNKQEPKQEPDKWKVMANVSSELLIIMCHQLVQLK